MLATFLLSLQTLFCVARLFWGIRFDTLCWLVGIGWLVYPVCLCLQVKDLEATINAVPADAVVSASPIDITKLIDLKQPVATVTYEIQDRESQGTKGKLSDEMDKFVKNIVQKS